MRRRAILLRAILLLASATTGTAYSWLRYEGYDADPGADYGVHDLDDYKRLEKSMLYSSEPPKDCMAECVADYMCHGFVTYHGSCYFRGGPAESPDHLVDTKREALESTLYVIVGKHNNPPYPPPPLPPPPVPHPPPPPPTPPPPPDSPMFPLMFHMDQLTDQIVSWLDVRVLALLLAVLGVLLLYGSGTMAHCLPASPDEDMRKHVEALRIRNNTIDAAVTLSPKPKLPPPSKVRAHHTHAARARPCARVHRPSFPCAHRDRAHPFAPGVRRITSE